MLVKSLDYAGRLILRMGILFSILAGAAMSVQGVLNTRLSEKAGLYEANVWVQGTAFALSLLAMTGSTMQAFIYAQF